MRVQTIALSITLAMLAACSAEQSGQHVPDPSMCLAKPGKPSNTNPNAPNDTARNKAKVKGNCDEANVFSVIFDANGIPTGVGGIVISPDPAPPADKNDKKVTAGETYCWVATDELGNPIQKTFAILFSPEDNPTNQKEWARVKINKNLKTGIKYKYTIWAQNEGEQGTVCGIIDPMFLIN